MSTPASHSPTATPFTSSRISPSRSATPSLTSSPTSSVSKPLPPPPGYAPSTVPSPQEDRDASLVNFYFLLLGLFIALVLLGWWGYRKRRKQKNARVQNGGRSALARDLEGWPGPGRRRHGGWRGMVTGHRQRTEEGLDERGEAPPPYKRSASPETPSEDRHGDDQTAQLPGHDAATNGSRSNSPVDTLSIPLRALSHPATRSQPLNQDPFEPATSKTGPI